MIRGMVKPDGANFNAGRLAPSRTGPCPRCLVWLLAFATAWTVAVPDALGQQRRDTVRVIRSQTGQFLVRGLPSAAAPFHAESRAASSYMRLDPSLLAVTCENLKEALLNLLETPDDAWRGLILIDIRPVRSNHDPVLVEAVHYIDGWRYHVEAPEYVDRSRFHKALVRLLLLEMANRRAGKRSSELPAWMGEGLVEIINQRAVSQLALEPNYDFSRSMTRRDPLFGARQVLQSRPPLSLETLNWPTADQLVGPDAAVYTACSHLLMHELLQMRGGAESFRAMLDITPEYLNWQSAFLRAFQSRFKRILDFDKWWSLTLIHHTGRDLSFTWSARESWEKFDAILTTPVRVRVRPNELPMNERATLQSILRHWEFRKQLPELTLKLNHLNALRLRVAPELAELVDGYRAALSDYLQQRSRPAPHQPRDGPMLKETAASVERSVALLDELDARREVLRRAAAGEMR